MEPSIKMAIYENLREVVSGPLRAGITYTLNFTVSADESSAGVLPQGIDTDWVVVPLEGLYFKDPQSRPDVTVRGALGDQIATSRVHVPILCESAPLQIEVVLRAGIAKLLVFIHCNFRLYREIRLELPAAFL
jgi:hypothetical protein